MNFFFEIVKLIRPLNITIAIFSSVIVFQLYPYSSINTLFQLILVLIFYMAAGNILNDYLKKNIKEEFVLEKLNFIFKESFIN